MPTLKSHHPNTEDLILAGEAFHLELLSFQKELERLESTDFLPRYNRIRFCIRCITEYTKRPLFITVRRQGSKIGDDNFYTIPAFIKNIQRGGKAEYDLLSFDSFNLPFVDMTIEMCQPSDYQKRKVSLVHIERSYLFAKEIKG